MIRDVVRVACVAVACWIAGATTSSAQNADPSHGPRFLAAWLSPNHVALDVTASAVFQNLISVNFREIALERALREIVHQSGLEISYAHHLLPPIRVSLQSKSIKVVDALARILKDTGLDVVVSPEHRLALKERRASSDVRGLSPDSGAIKGTVIAAASGEPVAGAIITIEALGRTAISNVEGKFRFQDLPAGSHRLRARFLGFDPGTIFVDVAAGTEATATIVLTAAPQPLEQVVVTGTWIPTTVKALPSPVTLIDRAEIELRHPRTTVQLLREAVPSTVGWDFGADPEQTAISLRGASTLDPSTGAIKVYLDGIEVSDRTFATIDPNSIERIEVIRGPQAAATYGSDAIGGVMQVFTKRGDSTSNRPALRGQASAGIAEGPYGRFGTGSALRQEYSGSVEGGTAGMSYHIGAGYTETDDWVPQGGNNTPSLYGSLGLKQGKISVDLSARSYTQNAGSVFDPRLGETGFIVFSKPFNRVAKFEEQTAGLRLSFAPTARWQHHVTAGSDQLTQSLTTVERVRTTPADTFLFVLDQNRTKTFVSYNTSLIQPVTSAVSANLTLGVDHYVLKSLGTLAFRALNTSGPIATDPAFPPSHTRTTTTNTGYFAQTMFSWKDAVFLTGGFRAERNSDLGEDRATQRSPRVGVSVADELGQVTIKVRSSYGESIRPPRPGQRDALVSGASVQVANPGLGPERQGGWDAGFDVQVGRWGTFGVSYYRQVAKNLIAFVPLDPATLTSQYQNVGEILNAGVEVEAAVTVSRIRARATFSTGKSRVQQLGATYTGDLRVGEQVLGVPRRTAGLAVSFSPRFATTVGAGLAYIGSWSNYDFLAQFSCFGGTGPCQSANRDYIVTYPGFAKMSLSLDQEITRNLTTFLTIDNLTNSSGTESANSVAQIGRVSMLGLRLQH